MLLLNSLVLLFCLTAFGQAADLTIQPKTVGKDVVKAVINKLADSRIFPRDQELMERIAYTESKFGKSIVKTYANDNWNGGIWKVDKQSFLQTQNNSDRNMRNIHFKIALKFKINWEIVKYDELEKPLHSGIASRLYLHTRPEKIPPTIAEQAQYWKKYYNKDTSVTTQSFVSGVKELQEGFVCSPPVDFCFVLDGSGSIDPADFERARQTISNFIDTMYCKAMRFCLVLYSTQVQTVFPLDTHDKNYMLNLIKIMRQPGSTTNTGGGIERATYLFNNATERCGVPREMFVVTDGNSNCGPDVKTKADEARRNNINVHAWGIGSQINMAELEKIADKPDFIEILNSYTQLAESVYKLKTQSCSAAQKPGLNNTVADQLKQNEKRYFYYQVPAKGLTVNVNGKTGKNTVYYSTSVANPSSALNDGQFTGSMQFANNKKQVYLAVEGLDKDNSYTFSAR